MSTEAPDARRFALEVLERLRSAGYEAYWAGGCVRDLMLGAVPKDFDVATSAPPDSVRKLFRRTVAVGQAFGVIRVLGPKGVEVEVATFRVDAHYVDGRRPTSVAFSTAAEDARRRDFTINGVFYDPFRDEFLDYVHGRADLEARIIRAIGDPDARFAEDKLRLLRAVRFAARLDFCIETKTAEAIGRFAGQLRVVSAERILAEVRLMLEPPTRRIALQLLRRHDLAPEVFEELFREEADAWNIGVAVADSLPRQPVSLPLAVAALYSGLPAGSFSAGVQRFFDRLKASNSERSTAVWISENAFAFDGARQAPLHRLKRLFACAEIGSLLDLHRALADRPADAEAIQKRRREDNEWTRGFLAGLTRDEVDPPPLLSGDDLIAAGFEPGPAFRPALDAVRDAQLDGKIERSDEALALARAVLLERDAGTSTRLQR